MSDEEGSFHIGSAFYQSRNPVIKHQHALDFDPEEDEDIEPSVLGILGWPQQKECPPQPPMLSAAAGRRRSMLVPEEYPIPELSAATSRMRSVLIPGEGRGLYTVGATRTGSTTPGEYAGPELSAATGRRRSVMVPGEPTPPGLAPPPAPATAAAGRRRSTLMPGEYTGPDLAPPPVPAAATSQRRSAMVPGESPSTAAPPLSPSCVPGIRSADLQPRSSNSKSEKLPSFGSSGSGGPLSTDIWSADLSPGTGRARSLTFGMARNRKSNAGTGVLCSSRPIRRMARTELLPDDDNDGLRGSKSSYLETYNMLGSRSGGGRRGQEGGDRQPNRSSSGDLPFVPCPRSASTAEIMAQDEREGLRRKWLTTAVSSERFPSAGALGSAPLLSGGQKAGAQLPVLPPPRPSHNGIGGLVSFLTDAFVHPPAPFLPFHRQPTTGESLLQSTMGSGYGLYRSGYEPTASPYRVSANGTISRQSMNLNGSGSGGLSIQSASGVSALSRRSTNAVSASGKEGFGLYRASGNDASRQGGGAMTPSLINQHLQTQQDDTQSWLLRSPPTRLSHSSPKGLDPPSTGSMDNDSNGKLLSDLWGL